MDWTRSGELLFMVILGGAGSLSGPVLGAAAILLLEEVLSAYTIYWQLVFGLFLIGVVLFALGLVKEEIGVFWGGTLLFMVGLAALARASLADHAAHESDSGHG